VSDERIINRYAEESCITSMTQSREDEEDRCTQSIPLPEEHINISTPNSTLTTTALPARIKAVAISKNFIVVDGLKRRLFILGVI
jgi:hypothetical protein